MRLLLRVLMTVGLMLPALAVAAAGLDFRPQEIANDLGMGYAVRVLDMNDDSRPDIVVVDTKRVVWYDNPGWQPHTLVQDQTKPDNVCIAPYDIDGDGKVDFALGADWRPSDTSNSGTIQWLSRAPSADDRWNVHAIGTEPTVHRMQWADLDGDGRKELIVVPLFGRGTTPPQFAEKPVRILSFKVPKDPVHDPWEPEVINEELHVAHNFWPTDLDGDGKLDLVVVSFEGVSLLKRGDDGHWSRSLIGSGNQQTAPSRGASEIKRGQLAGGRDYLATIEPWHGFQVVVYTRPETGAETPLWPRQVLDDKLQWGHAVACANLDGDADDELIIGVRDNKDDHDRCGLRIYDPSDVGKTWTRQLIDAGGVSIEDLTAADLDGDGKQDIVAVGRHTKNVRIYWNQSK